MGFREVHKSTQAGDSRDRAARCNALARALLLSFAQCARTARRPKGVCEVGNLCRPINAHYVDIDPGHQGLMGAARLGQKAHRTETVVLFYHSGGILYHRFVHPLCDVVSMDIDYSHTLLCVAILVLSD